MAVNVLIIIAKHGFTTKERKITEFIVGCQNCFSA